MACNCGITKDINSLKDLDRYEFIAHVKIKNVTTAHNVHTLSQVHEISFEILELFKGQSLDKILVLGSHPSLKGWSPCDLNENKGEEWIIFGYKTVHIDRLMTGICTPSEKIELQAKHNPLAATLPKKLRSLFERDRRQLALNK